MSAVAKTTQLNGLALTLILGAIQTVMPISTDLYLPALPTISKNLNVSPGAAQFTIAVFMIGAAIGQIIYGPITDKYGRKKPLLLGLMLNILGATLCAISPNINTLIAGRILQALGASACAVINAAIIRDLWSGKALADKLSTLMLVVGFAPIVAPSLGGLILQKWNWHGLFWCLVIFATLMTAAVSSLPETSSAQERSTTRLRDALSTYTSFLSNTPFMAYILTTGFMVGALFAYITGAPFMYMKGLGISPSTFAILFAITATGFVGAAQLNRLFLLHFSLFTVTRAAVMMCVLVALALMLTAISGNISVFSLTLLLSLLAASIGCTFPNISALAFAPIKERMGSAAAVQGTVMSLLGGISGSLVGALANGTTLVVTIIILGFALLGLASLLFAYQISATNS